MNKLLKDSLVVEQAELESRLMFLRGQITGLHMKQRALQRDLDQTLETTLTVRRRITEIDKLQIKLGYKNEPES